MRKIDAESLEIMENEERHNCNDCIHESVCEWAVYSEDITCKDFIDKKVLSERPQGEWIGEDEFHVKCSLCGFKHVYYRILLNYCPNCGADMNKEADND